MGGAQLIGRGINAAGHAVGAQIPGFTDADTQNYDQTIDRSNQYFQNAAGNSQTARQVGNLGGDLAAAMAVPGLGATTLPARMGIGALLGGGYSALQPITQAAPQSNVDYVDNKLVQALSGAALGGALPVAV